MGLLRFFIPDDPKIKAHIALAGTDDTEIQEYTHHWQTCTVCHYVICSCGNCHSEECNEVCLHSLSA